MALEHDALLLPVLLEHERPRAHHGLRGGVVPRAVGADLAGLLGVDEHRRRGEIRDEAEAGADSSKRTVYLSGAVTALSVGNNRSSGEPGSRSKVNFTSSEVSSRPLTGGLLWKSTPFLSVIT